MFALLNLFLTRLARLKNTTNLGSAKIIKSDICILGILPRPPILCPPWPALYPLILVEVQWTVLPWVENETPLEWRPQSLLCTNTQIWYDTTQSDNLRPNVVKILAHIYFLCCQEFLNNCNISVHLWLGWWSQALDSKDVKHDNDWLIPSKRYLYLDI